MSIHLSLLGKPTEPVVRSWNSRDTLLYALAVGAGAEDSSKELAFTTENSTNISQQVLPTFGCLVAAARSPRALGEYDIAKLVHAEQSVEFHAPLPPAGSVRAASTLTAAYDKGKAALLVQENVATDVESGEVLVTSTASFYIRGEGGFGGSRGPKGPEWSAPENDPDHVVTFRTRSDQPLLYRLTGDRNPLHSDPAVAARAGFPRPILHGMCTYGFTGRALLHVLADSDPARLRGMAARFSKPVIPGSTLHVKIWLDNSSATFQATTDDGTIVLDNGTASFLPT